MDRISICPSRINPTTELYLGRNFVGSRCIQEISQGQYAKVVIVVDLAIKELYGDSLATQLNALLIPIPNIKSKETYEMILENLFQADCGRDTLLIALGGGVICDLVGFAAATYMRGIPLILIPTTLLAMVDAAIGGKTAIDTPLGKNLIGCMYYPKGIIADLDLLKSLPEHEWVHGLSEILKMGLIYDASIWDDLQGDERIYKAIRGKISIVEQDPTELGLRRILNFGHTIGHGLEKIGGMPHGKAVALGCLAESHLSVQLKFLSSTDFKKIQLPFQNFSLQLPHSYTREKLFQAMRHDKKKAGGKLRIVLIDRIGHALPFEGNYCRSVSETELIPTLEWLEKNYA